MTKAIVTQINYAGLSFEGLMLPSGEYAIGLSQVAAIFQFDSNQASRKVKPLLGKGFQFDKSASELNNKKVNILNLAQLSVVIARLSPSNEIAMRFLMASLVEKLERVFDKAFNIVVEERERETRFAARLNTKATFRPLTDCLKEQGGFTEGWQYGKFIKRFQDALGFESGMRDDLDIPTLIRLGNCQSELACLIKAGYQPWDALELWIEQQW